jgi:hypothetical protein
VPVTIIPRIFPVNGPGTEGRVSLASLPVNIEFNKNDPILPLLSAVVSRGRQRAAK